MNKVKLAFLAIGVSLAIALTFSCSSGDSGGDNNGDNSNPNVPVDTKGKSVDDLLASGIESLKAEKWDEAVAYYDAAYDADNNNTKAIIYSVLANLAKISTDPKVVSLIKNNFGFTKYPDRLNALFSKEWLEKTPDYIKWAYYDESRNSYVYWYDAEDAQWYELNQGEGYYYRDYDYNSYTSSLVFVSNTPKYDSLYLPAIKTPDWVKGEAYNEALLSGNVFGSEAWALSLLANLLDRNTSGLNNLLDEVIDGVFGTSFNIAASRLEKLKTQKSRINLDTYFINELDLGDAFDKDDEIGWAEVNAVVSTMLLMKASLEWLQAYDLDTDLNWLKHSWKDEKTVASNFKNAQNVPFSNNFLKPRSGKSMNNAKASYIKAIQGLQESYRTILSSEIYPSKVKESYETINGGFDQLTAAIGNGSKFYIPENPTKGTWPTAKTGDVVGSIDFGKFFTAGYFSLDKIFEVSGGKPVFYWGYETCDYYYCDFEYEKLTNSSLIANRDDEYYSGLFLKLNVSYIRGIVDADDIDDDEFEYVPILPSGELAKAVFEKYYP